MSIENTIVTSEDKPDICYCYCMYCDELTLQINRGNTGYKCTQCQIPK